MNIFEAPKTNCAVPDFYDYDHAEKTVVSIGYLMEMEKQKFEYDLLLSILWESVELAPNDEDLDISITDLIQLWLKKYKGFEYQVIVDKLKAKKEKMEKKYGSREG